jgi:type I restriction enzyme S subunit
MSVSTNVKKAPKLRFPGFGGEWEEKKLGDIADFLKGRGIAKEDIKQEGQTKAIRYGELYTLYYEVIDRVYSMVKLSTKGLVTSKADDVIIPASGETSIDIAKASCVLQDGIALGGDINIIRSDQNGIFLSYYLNNAKKKDIARFAQGHSVVHLYASSLKKLILYLPAPEEQKKIARFLVVVDDKISALQKKKELLQKYKKGIMQKIFFQKIRFGSDEGKNYPDWQEKKLGEVTENLDSRRKPISSEKRTPGSIPYYGANGVVDYVENHIFDGEYVLVAEDGVVDVTKYPVHLVNGKFWANNHAHVLKGLDINNAFLYYSLLNTKFTRYITGSAQTKLNSKVLGMIDINLPSKEEQQKIADFLTSLDDKINTEERKLEQAKLFKKALLQQMFV